MGEGARGGNYVFYLDGLRFRDGIAEHFPFALGVSVHGYVSFEEADPATVLIDEADFVGFFEGDAAIFAGLVGIAPAEVRVDVVWGQVVAAGFYLFLFAAGINAVVHAAGVPNCLVALVVRFFVADEVFRADEADVEALRVAFGAGVFFIGGADDEAGRPAGSFGLFGGVTFAGFG